MQGNNVVLYTEVQKSRTSMWMHNNYIEHMHTHPDTPCVFHRQQWTGVQWPFLRGAQAQDSSGQLWEESALTGCEVHCGWIGSIREAT